MKGLLQELALLKYLDDRASSEEPVSAITQPQTSEKTHG
jgi:hypothetical protein